MESPRWLTVRDAATRATVSTATIQRWIREGRLGALELGGARTVYRIHSDDLDRIARQRVRQETADAPVDEPTFDARELLDSLPLQEVGGRIISGESHVAPYGERDSLLRELWMTPFTTMSVPEQIDDICRMTGRWLCAELVIAHIEETGWRFVSGREMGGVAEAAKDDVRHVMTGSDPVVSRQLPEGCYGQMASARIAGALRPAGAITACWNPGATPDPHYERDLLLVAGLVSYVVRSRRDQWLDMSEVAEQCNVKEATVRRWIRQDQLAAIVLGGYRTEYRVHTSDLDWFLYQRSRKRPAKHQRSVVS